MTDREKKLLEAAAADECSDEEFMYLIDVIKKIRDAQRFGSAFSNMVEQILEDGDDFTFATIKKYVKELGAGGFAVQSASENTFAVVLHVSIKKHTDLLEPGKIPYVIGIEMYEELENLSQHLLEDFESPPKEVLIVMHDWPSDQFWKKD